MGFLVFKLAVTTTKGAFVTYGVYMGAWFINIKLAFGAH